MKQTALITFLFFSLHAGYLDVLDTRTYLMSEYYGLLHECRRLALHLSITHDYPPTPKNILHDPIQEAVVHYLRRVNSNASRALVRHLQSGLIKI